MKSLRILSAILMLLPLSVTAQDDKDEFEAYRQQAQSEYNAYRDKEMADFAAFRAKANAEYAAFVEQAWSEMKAMEGLTPPASPKPKTAPRPKVDVPDRMPIELPYDTVITIPNAPLPVDVPDIVLPAEEEINDEVVDFFATRVVVQVVRQAVTFKLASLAEKEVARIWRILAKGKYDRLLQSCLTYRKKLNLCDWAYIQLCGKACEKVCGGPCNEAVILQAFILTQSGYRIRMATTGNKLVLLAPFDHTIYNYPFIKFENERYYILNKMKAATYRVCKAAFPKEHTASIAIAQQPKLKLAASKIRNFCGKRYPTMKASFAVNNNLINFYKQYPISNAWDTYTRASLSEETKQQLYPTLRKQISAKNQRQAVDMLLDFVQNSFEYKTDQEQFGYERPLFGDESFYYPFNDCEDRSILFSILVHELLGLDVVLLHYPGHLATAVHLTEKVEGDFLTIDGKRFIVCDPTYIGASVGMSMAEYKKSKVRIIRL